MVDTVGIHVVFTDLVGSTELSSRLGPEATEELRQVHFGLLRGAMEAHGGREVKNLGDGLMVVFPSLGTALDGSVAMQQAIERHNASGKEPLGIRVGLSTGDATEEDDDFFGEPVVEAARLCAKCEAGQIITTELVSLLARKSDHVFESIGDLELRGVPEPVPSVSVLWEPQQVEGSVPLPGRLQPDMPFALAGRVEETEALRQALKSAASGERRVTFLAGEPGIGKTRLSCELAVDAHADGAVVLYGRCDEELSVPYQPWVEALSHLLDAAPDDLVEEAVGLHGPELALLSPVVRRRYPEVPEASSTDPETERYRLLQAVTATLSSVAGQAPVVVVLDDLHWADTPSLTLLRHVVTNMTSGALLIVGTYRDSDLEAGHPLIDTVAALRREPGIERLSVRGLDDLETLALVEASAGTELTGSAREMAIALRQESAGNPFFAHEILRNLVESGTIYQDDDGEWVVVGESFEDLAIPESVRDVVGQRIARMGEEAQKTLTAAAVVGREFDLALVAEITGGDEDDLLDMFEAAVSAGVLVEVPDGDERFRFQHALARNTLADALSEGRRRRMHRKIAEALETAFGADPGDRIGELATHWIAATAPADAAKATHYARLAGQRAEAALAPDEAVRWFTTALEHHDLAAEPDERTRALLLVDLGTAQKHTGDPTYRETLLEASALAERLGDTGLMAAAALANSRGFNSKFGAVDEERVAGLEAAIAAVGQEPAAERALLLATLSGELEYSSPLEERMALIEEALTIARGLDDPATLAAVDNRFTMSFAVPQTAEARRAAATESLAIAADLGDLTIAFWAGVGAFQAALATGAADDARAALDQLTAAAAQTSRPSFRWLAGNLACSLLTGEGDTAGLEALAAENFAVGDEAGEPDAFDYLGMSLMVARWQQGRGIEIIDQVRQAAADNPTIANFTAVEGIFLADAGELDAARQLLQAVAADGFEFPVNNAWGSAIGAWASVTAILGDADAARLLYDLLAPWAGQVCTNRIYTHTTVDGVLGALATILGDHDTAEAHFAAAETLTDVLGARYFAAFDDLARAGLHLARGEADGRAQAEHYATRSLENARENGYAAIEQRASTFLAELAGS